MDQLDDTVTGDAFLSDLISSLFGQQIAPPTAAAVENTTCSHPVFRENTCTRCGAMNNGSISTTPLWYVYPNLSLNQSEINRVRNANLRTLLNRRKLHLVVDLDHTLVHTRVSWKLTPQDKQFLAHKRYGIDHNVENESGSLYKIANGWTKLRPYVRTFLREASTMFDMTVYTLSCRTCAWATAKVLDPDGSCFGSWRVITRDDCAGLDKHRKMLDVVLAHERVVLVVDDNELVWGDDRRNVIRIKPYNYFSYDSPYEEDIERNSSPPRKSWSQLGADESEENGELVKVLNTLRAVYGGFYGDLGGKGMDMEEYERRDVREVLVRVVKGQKYSKKGNGNKERRKKNV